MELVLENGAREFEVALADVVYDTPPLINYQRLVPLHPLRSGLGNGLGEEKSPWGSPAANLFAAQEDKAGGVAMMLGDRIWSGRGMNVLKDIQLAGFEHNLTWDEQTESAATTGRDVYAFFFWSPPLRRYYALKSLVRNSSSVLLFSITSS